MIRLFSKKCICVLIGIGISVAAFAYNPPCQGENLTGFINPHQMTAGFSTAGGPLLTITPSSVMVNPALGSYQNRVTLVWLYRNFTADGIVLISGFWNRNSYSYKFL